MIACDLGDDYVCTTRHVSQPATCHNPPRVTTRHVSQGDDPYPAEGAPGCPSERSPRGPHKCDADAAGEHADYHADKISFSLLLYSLLVY